MKMKSKGPTSIIYEGPDEYHLHLFPTGWYLFVGHEGTEPVMVRRPGGGWILKSFADDFDAVGKVVAGPYPCRKVALVVWRIIRAHHQEGSEHDSVVRDGAVRRVDA